MDEAADAGGRGGIEHPPSGNHVAARWVIAAGPTGWAQGPSQVHDGVRPAESRVEIRAEKGAGVERNHPVDVIHALEKGHDSLTHLTGDPGNDHRTHGHTMAAVSELGPSGGQDSNPFGFLGDLMKMFMADGPLNTQIARQATLAVATGGQVEPNVDPLDRLRLEELLRIADLHVADTTGLATAQTGRVVSVKAVTRAEWGYYTLDHYRPLFEGLARSLTAPSPPGAGPGAESLGLGDQDGPVNPGDLFSGLFNPADPEAGLLGSLPQVLGPFFLGAQAGTLCGHLASQAMGQYELPIPRPLGDELLMVPTTITTFATDWSLPPDDVRLWVCLSELTHHAVLGRPHVRERLDTLLAEFVSGFRVDPTALTGQLEQLDLTDPSSLPDLFNNPEALLGAVTTPAQYEVESQLAAVVSAVEGYVDHIVDIVGQRLIGSHGSLTEALRRRRVERHDADDLIRQLFGLELSRPAYERGQRFVNGVVERAGEEGLARLWRSAKELPTPAEIDAPGLWLERIDLPD